jgi:ABC-2 type transport system permease protein
MAELGHVTPVPVPQAAPLPPAASIVVAWTGTQTQGQFRAIAWLRWRIFVNSFRRKGGTGELIGRILLIPMLAGLAIGPSIAVGIFSFMFTQEGHLGLTVRLLWGTFLFCQFLNIQLGQPGSTFDPTELIRFPLAARDYVYIRLCFGLLTPANVIGTLMSFSIALGVILAAPSLWLYAVVALTVFAAANVLFSRMVFAWVDRWLATRRAREIFTGLGFAFAIGFQYLNFTFNPAYNHNRMDPAAVARVKFLLGIFHHAEPFLAWLPPELTKSALVAASQSDAGLYLGYTIACAVYALAFYLVFSMRMKKEFRGENLSDAANAVPKSVAPSRPAAASSPSLAQAQISAKPEITFGLPPVLLTILGKELLYVRRHTGILYALVMPVFLVLIVASKFASRGNASWVFPAAVAYSLLAISTMGYNAFGYEGAGVQFYFLAPVRLRDVVLGKNLMIFALAFTEIALTFIIITYVAGMPSPTFALVAVLWAAATLLISTLAGNRRSITTPKKINAQRMANKQVSQLSALIGMGILTGSAIVAAVPVGLALYFHVTWFLVPVFLLFAGAALYFYERSLRSIEAFAMGHRDQFFEEMCKAS